MNFKKEGLEKIYQGKTKDVYRYDEKKLLLFSKDAVTGWKIKGEGGKITVVEDPGANEVIGEIEGIGLKNIKSSIYYFELFKKAGLQTHYIDSDLDAKTMLVYQAKPLGFGLEFIVRFKAMGSILRAYPQYIKKNQKLHDFFEVTTKNDAAGDPRISKEILSNPDFGAVISENQYEECRQLCLTAAKLMKQDLEELGLELVDIKFELGKMDDKILLIDEVSAGIMRVFKDDKQLSEEELADIFITRKV